MQQGLAPETLAAQALGDVDPVSRALVSPIHPSTIYERAPDSTDWSSLAYTRADNPTYEHAERLLAALEGGAGCLEGGYQGCSLAEVTVRQGIERLLQARLPAVVAVVDITDHEARTDPFFTSAKR